MTADSQCMGPIVVSRVVRTGLRCPSQWEAKTNDGRYLYVRFRHDVQKIGIGDSVDDAVNQDGNVMKQVVHEVEMEYEQLKAWTEGVIVWPETYIDQPGPFYEINFKTGRVTASCMRCNEPLPDHRDRTCKHCGYDWEL